MCKLFYTSISRTRTQKHSSAGLSSSGTIGGFYVPGSRVSAFKSSNYPGTSLPRNNSPECDGHVTMNSIINTEKFALALKFESFTP